MQRLKFVCEQCQREFYTDVAPDLEARRDAEARALWGKRKDDPDMVRICEDCFQDLMGSHYGRN